MSKYPKISDDEATQKLYEECRKNGCTHDLAVMLAERKPVTYHNRMSPMHPRKNRGRGH